MKRKATTLISIMLMVMVALTTTAFALDEGEVESAIAASSQEAVAGNIFIWFLCAVGFLKISQKIDSFLASLGVNVGRTGGSMMGELMIAGRAVGAAFKGAGGVFSSVFNRGHASNSSSTTHQAAGQAFPGSGGGLVKVAARAVGNAAAESATGRGTGLSGVIGGAMYNSSMASGGKLAQDVVSAVATGNIASVGSIKGEKAAQALTSYLGYGTSVEGGAKEAGGGSTVGKSPASGAVASINGSASASIGHPPANDGVASPAAVGSDVSVPLSGDGEDTITLDGGAAAGVPLERGTVEAVAGATGAAGAEAGVAAGADEDTHPHIPIQAPTFRDVEIGGGRITGYEAPAGGGAERQFAMYNVNQYMAPTGPYETVQTVDGESWYKQYAQPTVQKTPHEEAPGKIKYEEKVVEQMPQVPKRKDRI